MIKLNMMKLLIIIVIYLNVAINTFATAQFPDRLIYNGVRYNLTVNPMELYFNNNPDKRPRPNVTSSALWRGYIATFEIIQNELWVVDIIIDVSTFDYEKRRFTNDYKSVIQECLDGRDRMKLDWFNGILILPQGRIIEYVHMGYDSIYENYVLILIENGNYIREINLNNVQYIRLRNNVRESFRNSSEYQELQNKINNGTFTEEDLQYFIYIFSTINLNNNILEE